MKPSLDDPNAPLKAGLRFGLIGLAILTVAGCIVAGPWVGWPGVWGVLVGAAIGGAFILITVVVILVTSNLGPSASMAAIMGSWVVKILAAMIITVAIKGLDFYNKGALVITLILAIVLVLGAEVMGVLRTQALYVHAQQDTETDADEVEAD